MNTKDISVLMKKHPFTAICGGLSLLLLAVYFFRQGGVPEAEATLAQKTTESRRLKGNVANAVSLKDHVDALEQANRNVDQRLVQAGDLAKNQQYFYKIEAETGVKLTDLRPGGTPTSTAKPIPGVKKQYSAVPYSCTVQGTYSQLLAFLRKLETGEHFQRILTATVNTSGGSGGDSAAAPDPVLSLSIAIEFLGQS